MKVPVRPTSPPSSRAAALYVRRQHASDVASERVNLKTKAMGNRGNSMIYNATRTLLSKAWRCGGVTLLTIVAFPSFGDPLSPEEVYTKLQPALCTIFVTTETGSGVGSGFRVSENGLVVTAAHVLEGATAAHVRCGTGSGDVVEIAAHKKPYDVVVLRTSALGPKAVVSGELEIRPGTQIYALGSPEGFAGSITAGLASMTRDEKEGPLLQISAPISPGSSGGPVVNNKGEVLAIAIGGWSSGQNLNFAISATVLGRLDQEPIKLSKATTTSIGPNPANSSPAKPIVLDTGSGLKFRSVRLGDSCAAISRAEKASGSYAIEWNNPNAQRKQSAQEIVDQFSVSIRIREMTGWFVALGAAREFEHMGYKYASLIPRVFVNTELVAAPATAKYLCDSKDRLVVGRYRLSPVVGKDAELKGLDSASMLSALTQGIESKYPGARIEPDNLFEGGAFRIPCDFTFPTIDPDNAIECFIRSRVWNVTPNQRIQLTYWFDKNKSKEWPGSIEVAYLDAVRLAALDAAAAPSANDKF